MIYKVLPHIREFRISESGKCLLLKSGILGYGIPNTAQGIGDPTNDWNSESKFYLKRIRNPTAWNPESKNALIGFDIAPLNHRLSSI